MSGKCLPTLSGSPESRNAASARAEAAGWDRPLTVKLVFTENCNLCRLRFAHKLWGLQISFTWLRRGPRAKKQWTSQAGLPVPFSVPWCPNDFLRCGNISLNSTFQYPPEFGKLTEARAHTLGKLARGRSKLEGAGETAQRNLLQSYRNRKLTSSQGHLCTCVKHSLGWVLLEPNRGSLTWGGSSGYVWEHQSDELTP